jgi:hypothetical protein
MRGTYKAVEASAPGRAGKKQAESKHVPLKAKGAAAGTRQDFYCLRVSGV